MQSSNQTPSPNQSLLQECRRLGEVRGNGPSRPPTPISRPGNKQVTTAVNKSTHPVLARTNEKYPSRNPLQHALR